MIRAATGLFLGLALILIGAGAARAAPADEQQRWLSVSAIDSAAAYTEFLQQYPDGTFSAIARVRLDQLNSATRYAKAPAFDPVDRPQAKPRPVQSRTIVPRAKPDCFEKPDAACVVFEQEKAAQGKKDDTSPLLSLGRAVAAAGDVKRAENYLRQAAAIARAKKADVWVAERNQAGELADAAQSMFGVTPEAEALLKEALETARRATSDKGNDETMEQRGEAIARVAEVFATTGQSREARRAFAEAASVAAQGSRIDSQIEIAEEQAKAGYLQDAMIGISDALMRAKDKPQIGALGTVEVWRYFTIAKGEKALVRMGQEEAALSLARFIGPLGIRLEHMLGLRNEIAERGAGDLSALDKEVLFMARQVAEEKDAWMKAEYIGCAVARFDSVKAGTMLARNLLAQSPQDANRKARVEQQIAECLAKHVGAEQAAEYFETTTSLRLQKNSEFPFKWSAKAIGEAFIRSGNPAAVKEWAAKLEPDDTKSMLKDLDESLEQGKREEVRRLTDEKRFADAISEARKLRVYPDSSLHAIAVAAAEANDVKTAIQAAQSMADKQNTLDAYLAFLQRL